METLKRVGRFLAPEAEKEDGRDTWPNRTAFVLASMGGAVGLGNLLRYPSVVFANNGLQWFIPYLIALIFLAIPILILEISIGQAFRGGCVVAYDHVNKRTKGVGLSIIMNGYVVVTYYVPILAWVMVYFRHSFTSPLPWTGRGDEFYTDNVIRNPEPNDSGTYLSYPATGIIGETAGWCAFTWFVVWLCMFKGVGLTGRVVYFTMGLPIVMVIVLIGGAASMDNAVEGVRLYMGQWHSSKLGGGDIWQAACGQIFFSIGVGFGYFTSYASYNTKFSNAVQDALIISCSNSLFEVIAAFAVFSVVGYLGLRPSDDVVLGTFTVGFLTYPAAITDLPGANFWAVLFFATLMLLGISSAFALLEAIVTMVTDTDWGKRIPRSAVSSAAVVVSFLLSLLYCTRFGYYLLDAVDTWTNNLALIFVVWCEAVVSTTVYRWKDVVSQVGLPAFLVYNAGYLGGQIFGVAVAHAVIPGAGAGLGFGLYILGLVSSLLIAKTPTYDAPRFWGKNVALTRFWWVAAYSGNQLRRDLNMIVATGNNWAIPSFWGPVIKYISAPILAIIFSFSYPSFYQKRHDPLHIFAFTVSHVVMVIIASGFVFPRFLDVLVPRIRRGEKEITAAPNENLVMVGATSSNVENGSESRSDGSEKKPGFGGPRGHV